MAVNVPLSFRPESISVTLPDIHRICPRRETRISRPTCHALLVEPLIRVHAKTYVAVSLEPNRFREAMSCIVRKLDLVALGNIAGRIDNPGCFTPKRRCGG